jgi:hypothetical protein
VSIVLILNKDQCLQDQVAQGQHDRTAILIPFIDRWQQALLEKYIPEYATSIKPPSTYCRGSFKPIARARASIHSALTFASCPSGFRGSLAPGD